MSDEKRPIIIRRKKVIVSGGHKGGAWKVAYADFVTAMMAFFLMMWLLNATTEDQRKGLADYFSPTIPVSRISGGGSSVLYGADAAETDSMLKKTGGEQAGDKIAMDDMLEEALEDFRARSGESTVADTALRHIVTRVTDEGLAVDLFDLPGAPLFTEDGTRATAIGAELLALVDRVFANQTNRIAVSSHVGSDAVVRRQSGVWPISAARAEVARRSFADGLTGEPRIERTTANADRKPVEYDRMDVRNNRLELILLRE